MEPKHIQRSTPYSKNTNKENTVRNIYYGEVVSIEDQYDGGRIKVRIADLDNKTQDEQLPWAFPATPKFMHVYPQVGEVVRVFIEDTRYPQRGRHWVGSVISQLHKIGRDGYLTALNTTNVGLSTPDKAPSTFPEAKGVFPAITDIGLIGRDNTDVLLKERQVMIRAGKHEVGNVLTLNKKNQALIQLDINKSGTQSSILHVADKIALIAHDGNPKFPAINFDEETITKIFAEGHPLGRGDIIVQVLELMRNAILQHIHPYSGVAVDKSGVIIDLEKVDFTKILQNNIRIN